MKKQQIQQQKQLTAHDKILLFNNLRYLLEGLEEYIEKAGYYSDFKNKRQLQNITIPKERSDNLTADSAEHFFKTNLILFVSMVEEAPPSEREKLVEEYLKWINVVGIDPNNCPEKLRQFLIEIKSVLEGDSERILQQTKEYLDNKDKGSPYPTDPKDTLTLFGLIQRPLNKNREDAKSYEGKTYRDVEAASKFSGNVERGKETFDRIAGTGSSSSGFHFYSHQQSTSLQQKANFEIIQDIRQNPQNWRIDEIIVEFNNFGGTRQEVMLIHQSARLDDYDQRTGRLNFEGNAIYRANQFSAEEQAEINRALNISQQSSSAQVQQPPYK
jgi:hypothetical protein